MPIEIEWVNDEKTLIRWNFVGRWTAEDFHETIRKSNELITAQDHTVNHIIDFSQSVGLPANVIKDARYGMSQMPKNLGQVVVIAEGRGVEFLAGSLQRFSWFSNKIHLVKSNEEAIAFFQSL